MRTSRTWWSMRSLIALCCLCALRWAPAVAQQAKIITTHPAHAQKQTVPRAEMYSDPSVAFAIYAPPAYARQLKCEGAVESLRSMGRWAGKIYLITEEVKCYQHERWTQCGLDAEIVVLTSQLARSILPSWVRGGQELRHLDSRVMRAQAWEVLKPPPEVQTLVYIEGCDFVFGAPVQPFLQAARTAQALPAASTTGPAAGPAAGSTTASSGIDQEEQQQQQYDGDSGAEWGAAVTQDDDAPLDMVLRQETILLEAAAVQAEAASSVCRQRAGIVVVPQSHDNDNDDDGRDGEGGLDAEQNNEDGVSGSRRWSPHWQAARRVGPVAAAQQQQPLKSPVYNSVAWVMDRTCSRPLLQGWLHQIIQSPKGDAERLLTNAARVINPECNSNQECLAEHMAALPVGAWARKWSRGLYCEAAERGTISKTCTTRAAAVFNTMTSSTCFRWDNDVVSDWVTSLDLCTYQGLTYCLPLAMQPFVLPWMPYPACAKLELGLAKIACQWSCTETDVMRTSSFRTTVTSRPMVLLPAQGTR